MTRSQESDLWFWEAAQETLIDQSLEMCHRCLSDGAVAKQYPDFDIPIHRGRCKVRRCNKQLLRVGNYGLRVQDAFRTTRTQGSRVIVDGRTFLARPVFVPKAIGESLNDLPIRFGSEPRAIDVQQDSHSQGRALGPSDWRAP